MGRTRTIDDAALLAAAARLFRERGHTVSTREIARAVGMSEAVLYQRFGSKDDLFFASMTPGPVDVEALLEGAEAVRSADDARAYLQTLAKRIGDLLAHLMPTFLQVLAYPATDSQKMRRWHQALPFEPLSGGLSSRFRALRDGGHICAADPAASAHVFLATVHSAVLVGRVTGHAVHGMPGAAFSALVDALWQGLAPLDAQVASPRVPRPAAPRSARRSRSQQRGD